MSNNEVKEKIQNIIFKSSKNGTIGDDESLLLNGLIDSLKMIELTNYIEKSFNIKIEDDELMPDNFDSINAITNFIMSKIS